MKAANYNRFDGQSWKSNARWNRLTLFGELREKLAKADIGDLVRVTGSFGESSYKADGRTNYSVELIADSFAILAKRNGNASRVSNLPPLLQVRRGHTNNEFPNKILDDLPIVFHFYISH